MFEDTFLALLVLLLGIVAVTLFLLIDQVVKFLKEQDKRYQKRKEREEEKE